MTSFSSKVGFCTLLGLLILLSTTSVFAQTVTGSISGTVKDSSGLVLPNAKVEVLNQDTGVTRTLQTDGSGYYSAVLLPLGMYKVTATVQGFQTEVRTGIELTVGREAVVDLSLSVGATTQTVEVSAEAALINTTTATIQGLVSGEQIRELPLNGRSYNDLALLNPGVVYNNARGSSASDGYGVRMSVNGSRANANLFLMDGTVTNDTSQTAGTVNSGSLGVEGIREFTVLTHNYGAEFGRSAGGVVNAITRSGTNQLHGSLYEFIRNSAVDARDFFQQTPLPGDTVAKPAPFRRNQFGGAIGGKIKRDKIFFFANYEGFRQSLAQPIPLVVPNALARTGTIPINGVPTFVGVNPKMVPYINMYPLPGAGSADNGDGTARMTQSFKQPINEDYFMQRGDFTVSDKDTLYARYVYNPSIRLRQNPNQLLFPTEDKADNHFAQIGGTHVFSPTMVNEFRVAFNRTDRHTAIGPPDPAIAAQITPALSFVPGQDIGRFSFSNSLASFGNLNATPVVNLQNVFEESDTLTMVKGKHSFKVGFDLQRIQTNTVSAGGIRGSWQFASLQSFLLGQPSQLEATKLVGQTPVGFSVNEFGWRHWLPAWFIHDDFRVNSRLTLNIGLRHEFFTDLKEAHGQTAALVNLTDAESTVGRSFSTAKMNFAPRFGLAWDPTGSGKTSVRVGVGTYYNQINQREAGISDYRFSATYSGVCASTPAVCVNFPQVPLNPQSFLGTQKSEGSADQLLKTPTVIQYSLDVQRQLTSTMTLRVGYVGWNGYNMTRAQAWNTRTADPATGLILSTSPRPNPAFQNITLLSADSIANYHSLQAELRKRLSAGLSFQVAYTYAKALAVADSTANRAIDNGGTYLTMDPRDPNRDYGRSAYDQRQVVVINSQYLIPTGRVLGARVPKAIFGGWTAGGIWQYGSGTPLNALSGFNNSRNGDTVNPDRPDVKLSYGNNPTNGISTACPGFAGGQQLRTPDRWFDPCAFSLNPAGTFGNVGRNTMNGPGVNQMSFTMAKSVVLSEGKSLQFRAEFFNLFNHAQFYTPILAVFQSSRAANGSAGAIQQTPNAGLGGRNLQAGLKFIF